MCLNLNGCCFVVGKCPEQPLHPKGTILGENRLGYWLVYFDGEIFQDEDGIWSKTEIDVGVKEEDLKVIKESD